MVPLLEIGRSMRRSYARRAVLCALDELGTAHAARIAERSRQTAQRVHAVLHGNLPGFRPDLSLLALELVRTAGGEGSVYEITARGRLVVKSLQRGGLKLLVEGPVFPEGTPAPVAARDASRDESRGDGPRGEGAREGVCPTCGQARKGGGQDP